MLMVLVMYMRMRVHHGLVDVLVFVTLGNVQPDTYSHEPSCCEESDADRLSQRDNGGNRSQERRRREIGSRSRSTQITKR